MAASMPGMTENGKKRSFLSCLLPRWSIGRAKAIESATSSYTSSRNDAGKAYKQIREDPRLGHSTHLLSDRDIESEFKERARR
jgi:hypothetical protein